jgi:ketosteroid isomerase-like protein
VAALQPVPAEKPAKPAPVANNSGEVLETLHAWAAAWSAQDVDKYLSFYAADFKVPGGQSRAAWEATRRARLTQPEFIEVGISNANVEFRDAGQAAVKFHQSYRASHMKASGKKNLVMVKAGGKWRIREENAQ